MRAWDLALTLGDVINHGYKVRSCNISLFLLSYFSYVVVAFDKHDHIDHNLLGWLMG